MMSLAQSLLDGGGRQCAALLQTFCNQEFGILSRDPFHDLFGKRLAREVRAVRVLGPQGEEALSGADVREVVESADGSVETFITRGDLTLPCGHLHRLGHFLAQCELCSREAKAVVHVCSRCHVVCPVCGRSLCLRHTQPSPSGARYCKRCYRKGLKLEAQRQAGGTTVSGSGGLISRILEWW